VSDVYAGLRRQALELTPEQIGSEAPVLAMLMETGYEQAVATLLAVADGTTSLYFSNGGGIIGAGAHESVAAASRRWLDAAGSFLAQLHPVDDPGVPALHQTQFVAVTPGGLRGSTAAEEELGRGGHPLSPLFYAAQDVITQIRLTQSG
jgi:hypothetical protein